MRVVVSGASGFIGRHLVSRLISSGDVDVVALTRSGSIFQTSGVSEVRVDLLHELENDNRLPGRIDVCIHLAQSDRYQETTIEAETDVLGVAGLGTQRLFKACIAAGAKRLIYVSSGSVYEDYSDYPLTEAYRGKEQASLNARAKRLGESVAMDFGNDATVLIPRLFFPYGRGQKKRMLNAIASRIQNGEPVHLDGENGLCFCPSWVDDICDVLERSLTIDGQGAFNLAGREVVTIRHAAEIIGSALGKVPTFSFTGKAAPVIVADLTKFHELMPNAMPTSFEDGISQVGSSLAHDGLHKA